MANHMPKDIFVMEQQIEFTWQLEHTIKDSVVFFQEMVSRLLDHFDLRTSGTNNFRVFIK